MHFLRLATALLKHEETARHNQPFSHNSVKYSPILKMFSNKPLGLLCKSLFSIPPNIKYVTTVPYNLSLVTTLVCDCRLFSDINVPRCSVPTHMRCGGIFNKCFSANLLKNLTVK